PCPPRHPGWGREPGCSRQKPWRKMPWCRNSPSILRLPFFSAGFLSSSSCSATRHFFGGMLPDKMYIGFTRLVSIKLLPYGACCNPMQEGSLRVHPPIAGTVPVLPSKEKKISWDILFTVFFDPDSDQHGDPERPDHDNHRQGRPGRGGGGDRRIGDQFRGGDRWRGRDRGNGRRH